MEEVTGCNVTASDSNRAATFLAFTMRTPKKPKLGYTCQVLLPKSSACNGAFAGGLKEIFPMILLQVLFPKEPCGATALDFSRQDMSPALWFPSERGLTRVSHPAKAAPQTIAKKGLTSAHKRINLGLCFRRVGFGGRDPGKV